MMVGMLGAGLNGSLVVRSARRSSQVQVAKARVRSVHQLQGDFGRGAWGSSAVAYAPELEYSAVCPLCPLELAILSKSLPAAVNPTSLARRRGILRQCRMSHHETYLLLWVVIPCYPSDRGLVVNPLRASELRVGDTIGI